MCNVCTHKLSHADVCEGWSAGDAHDYCITCRYCKGKGVARFAVSTEKEGFKDSGMDGKHKGKLYCEFLSPWVLRKEMMSILNDDKGVAALLDPEFPNHSNQKATIFWNLIVSLKR